MDQKGRDVGEDEDLGDAGGHDEEVALGGKEARETAQDDVVRRDEQARLDEISVLHLTCRGRETYAEDDERAERDVRREALWVAGEDEAHSEAFRKDCAPDQRTV